MQERLEELRGEYRRGMEELARLDARRLELQRTLLRISGAVQVLEELTRKEDDAADARAAGPRIQAVAG